MIYIKEESEWCEIERCAEEDGRSVSAYLVQCHRRQREVQHEIESGQTVTHLVGTEPHPAKTTSTVTRGIVADIQKKIDVIVKPKGVVSGVPFRPQPKERDK